VTEFLTLREAADRLKLKPQSIKNLKARGVLKRGVHWFQRPGEIGVRFDAEALEAWVRESVQPSDGIPMANGGWMR
jgi:hypothetical protein